MTGAGAVALQLLPALGFALYADALVRLSFWLFPRKGMSRWWTLAAVVPYFGLLALIWAAAKPDLTLLARLARAEGRLD